jgi:hypothetical protein
VALICIGALDRHHCRVSGEVICGGCSLEEDVEGKTVRISLRAFKEYSNHFDRVKKAVPRVYFGREFGHIEVPKETQIKRVSRLPASLSPCLNPSCWCCACAHVRMRVRACLGLGVWVRACVCARVRACVRASVR